METSGIKHIGDKYITVLIHFVGVSRLVTTRSSKGKLCNCVKSVLCFGLVCFINRGFLIFRPLSRLGVRRRLALSLAKKLFDLLTCLITRLGKNLIVGRNLWSVSSLTLNTSLAWSRAMVERLMVSLMSTSIV
jgi:hypothetical protein